MINTSSNRVLPNSGFMAAVIFFTVSLFPVYLYLGNPALTPGRVVVFLSILYVIYKGWLLKTFESKLGVVLVGLFFLYFMSRFFSIFQSEDLFYAVGSITLEFGQIYVCFILGYLFVKRLADPRVMRNSLILLFWFCIGYVMFEYFFQFNRLSLLASGDSLAAKSASIMSFRNETYRAQGVFEHPLSLAQFCVIAIVCVSFMRKNILVYITILGLFLCLLTTGSRIGVLVVVFALFMAVFLRNLNFKAYGQVYLVFLVALIIIGGGFFYIALGFQTEEELTSTVTRLKQWEVTYNLFLMGDWGGLGIGSAAQKLVDYSMYDSNLSYILWRETIDSLPLLRLVESGPISFFLFLVIVCVFFIRLLFLGYFSDDLILAFSYYTAAFSLIIFFVSALATVMPLNFLVYGGLFAFSGRLNEK